MFDRIIDLECRKLYSENLYLSVSYALIYVGLLLLALLLQFPHCFPISSLLFSYFPVFSYFLPISSLFPYFPPVLLFPRSYLPISLLLFSSFSRLARFGNFALITAQRNLERSFICRVCKIVEMLIVCCALVLQLYKNTENIYPFATIDAMSLCAYLRTM